MNKNLKLLTTSLLLCGSLLSAVPAHAEVTDLQEGTAVESVEAVEVENDTELVEGINARSCETAVINANAVALRKSPNLSSTVLERLNKGDIVYFVELNKTYYGDGYEWVHVAYSTGGKGYIYGYVASKYIRA